MTDTTATSESDEIYLEHEADRATLKGSAQNPVRMEYTAPARADATPTPNGLPVKPPQATKSRSQKAVLDEDNHQVTLTGQVNVDMPDEQMLLNAESVTLQFGDDNSVIGFQARGDVVMVQPGRRVTADSARSQNRMQSVLLQGRARAQQQGQFDLASDRMEVYTDPKKGMVRSEDRQRPINTSVDLKSNKPYKLLEAKFQALVDQGVPPDTLEKLRPILDQSYRTQDAFRKDASDLLTAEETQRYMSLILAQAH
jgi:lipopolysaccharide export system protein LptA